jgi:hypothetical protein
MMRKISRRGLAIIGICLGLTLVGSAVAYTAITYTISEAVTVGALMQITSATNGSNACAVSGLTITCPAYATQVGQSWNLSFTIVNHDSTSHVVNIGGGTQNGGSVISINSFSPPGGTSVAAGGTTTFICSLTAVGPGSDTISLTVTA